MQVSRDFYFNKSLNIFGGVLSLADILFWAMKPYTKVEIELFWIKGGLYFDIRFGEFGLGKKVSVLVSDNLGSEKVSVSDNLVSKKKNRFRKIWSRKKNIGLGLGKFCAGKEVSVSENLVSEKKSQYQFRSKFWYRHSVPLNRKKSAM